MFADTTPKPTDSLWTLTAKLTDIGASGVGGAADYIAYAGPPLVNPPLLANIVVDINGAQWQYFAGAWH